MRKKRRFGLFCVLLMMAVLSGCTEKKPQQYQAVYYDIFDTVTTIIGYAQTEEEFLQTADTVHEQLKQYHQWFDIYHEYGENNLKTINDNAGKSPVKVEEEIVSLLLDCRSFYEETETKVNPAMGSVLSLWHEARNKAVSFTEAAEGGKTPEKAEILPTKEQLEEASKHCSFETVLIDKEASTVYLTDEKQSLDVGAIAKGWAVERVAENVPEGYLISVGGNVCVTGAKPDGSGWKIGIQDPINTDAYVETVEIFKGSVVTSGDYQRYIELEGERYHHLIDPQTLYPAKNWKSVTVICEDSGTADVLSTALFLMSKEEGEALLRQQDAKAIWIDAKGERIHSEGF